jgi:CBS domain-containing protein
MKPLRDLDVPRADATGGIVRSVMQDDLSKLGQDEVLTVRPEEKALDVVRRMKQSLTDCALVHNGEEMVGIFTARDVLGKLTGARASENGEQAISELMTQNPDTLKTTDTVAAALNKMSVGRYRHVPVTHKDGSYTVTSIKHVLRYIAQEDW